MNETDYYNARIRLEEDKINASIKTEELKAKATILAAFISSGATTDWALTETLRLFPLINK